MKYPGMDKNKKNSFWLSAQYLSTLIFSLINLKLNLNNYGETAFGIWITLFSFWGIGSALDFGFGTALVKFVAEEKSTGFKKINQLLSSSLIFTVLTGVFIFAAGNVAGHYLYILNQNIVPQNMLQEAGTLFLVMGISFFVRYLIMFFTATFEGLDEFYVSSKINIINNSLTLVFVIGAFIFKFSLVILAVLYSASSFITLIIFFAVLKVRYPLISFNIKNFEIASIKRVYSFSLSIQGMTILGGLIDPVIKYVIGNFYNTGFVSYYEIARRLSTSISGLFHATFRNYLPKTSILKTVAEYKNYILSDGIKLSRLGITYSGLMFGILTVFVTLFIHLWFGYQEAIIIFLILSLPEVINNFGYSVYVFFIGIGHTKFLIIMQLINLVGVTITTVVGFYFFKNVWGLLGYFLTVILVNILMFARLKKYAGINIKEFLKGAKFGKLVTINLLLLAATVCIYFGISHYYIILGITSLLSGFMFYKDILQYARILRNLIPIKFF